MNITNLDDNQRKTISVYFLMLIIFMIVMLILWMIGNDRPVPDVIGYPFSMIISYLLGVKTPDKANDNVNSTQ